MKVMPLGAVILSSWTR